MTSEPKPIYWRPNGGYQPAPQPPSPPARTWRAKGGYQDIKTSPPQQKPSGAMYWPPWYCTQWAGQQCVRGPVPVNGVFSCPPPPQMPPPAWWGWGAQGPLPPYAPVAASALAPAPAKAEEKKEDKKGEEKGEEKKEEAKVENPDAPPKLDDGVNYMFHTGHTMLHIFNKAAPIWEEKYQKQELRFKMFKTPTTFTPKLIIEKVLRKEGDECKGWAVTEAHERGDGVWAKGMSIEYTSDKAGNALPSFGWSVKRGNALPPVWLVVHKV